MLTCVEKEKRSQTDYDDDAENDSGGEEGLHSLAWSTYTYTKCSKPSCLASI